MDAWLGLVRIREYVFIKGALFTTVRDVYITGCS